MPKRIILYSKVTFLSALFLLVGLPAMAQSARSVARDFTKDIRDNHRTILIQKPSLLYKYNLKVLNNKKYALLSKHRLDSLAMAKSDFVKNIRDSIFTHFFLQGYTTELKKFGFQTFIGKMPIPSKKPDYYANVVQSELEEQYYRYTDTAYVGEKAYVFNKELNALDVSFWFKVYASGMSESEGKHVYFAENLLVDNLDGQFQMASNGTLVYVYKVKKLDLSKIYTYIAGLGKDYADFTFNQLMNNYVRKRLPESKIKGKYWYYDPVYKTLFTGDYAKFVVMKQQ